MTTAMCLSKQLRSPRCAALIAQLGHDECGQDLIEYALVAALVGLAAISALKGLSSKLGTAFTDIGTTLTNSY